MTMRALQDVAAQPVFSEGDGEVAGDLTHMRRRMEHRTLALAGLLHDLRRPLTRLRLRLEMIDDATRTELAGDVADMEAMIAATLNALCEIATHEPMQWIDVNAMLADVQADFRRTGSKIIVHGRAAALYWGRPVMLTRCLSNLIDNAIKFAGAASIHLTDEAHLRITVKDRGPGIPHDELERVFEPFYRTQHAHLTAGAGLGLWIAREAAAAHGGRVVLRNGVRRGAEAELTLPRTVHATAGCAMNAQRSLRSVPMTEPPAPATNIV
jgi:signal transduction histidine kinase